MQAANMVRFGVGRYANVDAIRDPSFGLWLPPAATDIVMHTHINGYHARFKIDQQSLDDWFRWCWSEREGEAVELYVEPGIQPRFEPAKIEEHFGALGNWKPPEGTKWILYEGPRQSNWAGASTWFDPQSRVGYQDTAFW